MLYLIDKKIMNKASLKFSQISTDFETKQEFVNESR